MNPPIFYPGKKLKASDLIDLEKYILARNNIITPDHGVIKLYSGDEGPYQSQDRLDSIFILEEVVGITPSGRPIQFKADSENLTFRFRTTNQTPLIYDIYVDDLHQKPENEEKESNQKYQLSYESVNDEQIRPMMVGDRLYIGRYKLQSGSLPEMIEPPLPYCLASIRYPSTWWNEWTLPIRKSLRVIAENYSDDHLVIQLVSAIAFNYIHWPLSKLIRTCYQLQWLKANSNPLIFLDEGMMQEMTDASTLSKDFNPWQGRLPYELPTVIAEIFGDGGEGRWQFLSEVEYTNINRLITITRKFQSNHELKIQFKEEVDTVRLVKFIINSQTTIYVTASADKDIFNRPCWFYIIEHIESSIGNFTIKIPNNLPSDFSIYYRAKQ